MNDLVFTFLNYLSIGISFVFLILAIISAINSKKIKNALYEDIETVNPLLRVKKYYKIECNIHFNCVCLECVHFFILLTLSIFASPIYILRFGTWLLIFIFSILSYKVSYNCLKELKSAEHENLEE